MSGRQGVSFTLKQALISSTDMSVPCNLTQVTQHVPYTQPVAFSIHTACYAGSRSETLV